MPLWSAQASPRSNTLIAFTITDDAGTQWYAEPFQADANKTVVGVRDETFAINVFHVTSHTAKDIPMDIIIDPTNTGGSDGQA